MRPRNIAASVRARLLNDARNRKLDFNLVLTRYALERMLYRLSISPYQTQFLLKGALLFDLWFDEPHRPTHDADLLGFGSADVARMEEIFRKICQTDGEDGIIFQADSVRAREIRKDANYSGVRVTLQGILDGARCPIQVDIGFGDAVTPQPDETEYPVILEEMPAPRLRVYPRYTVIAEKLEAIVSLGMLNTRMKDYFDLWILALHASYDGQTLASAIKATFLRRNTRIPAMPPVGLTETFAFDETKGRSWAAFLQRNELSAPPLAEVIRQLGTFLQPPMSAIMGGQPFRARWQADTGWLPKDDG